MWGVVVVRPGLGVRVLDLASRRRDRVPVRVLVERPGPGAESNVVGASAALRRLVVVVADRVPLGERLQVRRVAGRHVVEAHADRALEDRGRRYRAVVVAGGGCPPPVELHVVGGRVVPPLVETGGRVAAEPSGVTAAAGGP